jgi:hypothetical protein
LTLAIGQLTVDHTHANIKLLVNRAARQRVGLFAI